MRVKELRAMSSDALQGKLQQLKIDIAIEKRKIAATGVQSKKIKVKEIRKTIAQILTLLKERGAIA